MIIRFLAFVFITTTFINCSSQEYKIEDKIFDCIEKQFKNNGVDLEKSITSYESFLIEQGYLNNQSGASYIEVYKKFAETGFIIPPPLHPEEIFPIINGYHGLFISPETPCASKEEIQQLRSYKIYSFIESQGDLNMQAVFAKMAETYTSKDFDQLFYKYSFLSSLVKYATMDDSGISRKLPPTQKDKPITTARRNIIEISLNKNNKLFLNDKPILLKKLKNSLIPYILGNDSDKKYPETTTKEIDNYGPATVSECVIRLRNNRETSYAFYIAVQNEIIAAYYRVRDQKSKELFNKTFEKLSDQNKKIIQAIIPERLKEGEPIK